MQFPDLRIQPADPLLHLASVARSDSRRGRLDLSVGVYRAEDGTTPVMRAVKMAERRLWEQQSSKAYLGVEGNADFLEVVRDLLLGEETQPRTLAAIQTPGGTGALRLAADLLRVGKAGRRIWIGTPTWSNHMPIFAAAGLEIRTFPIFDLGAQRLMIDSLLDTLAEAEAGDAVLLQPVCHNPTGAGFTADQIASIGDALAARGLVPLLDVAYHGFGSSLDADAEMVRGVLRRVPDALIAYSCSKNFGLYRERVGALFALSETGAQRDLIAGNLQAIARANYSMPPDHGAAVVTAILGDDHLSRAWRAELAAMADRVRATRQALSAHGHVGMIDLAPIADQAGMFSLIPVSPDMVRRLRHDHAIYLPESGRINIAGMTVAHIPSFVAALQQAQMQSAA